MLRRFIFAAALLALAAATPARARDYKLGNLTIEHPFARATTAHAMTGAAYFSVRNAGAAADRLIAVKAAVSKRVGLHTNIHEGGIMKMRPIKAVEVPAAGRVELKPGGKHVMFMGLKAPLVKGHEFPLTLVFEHAGEITVQVEIEGIAAMRGAGAGQGTHKSQ